LPVFDLAAFALRTATALLIAVLRDVLLARDVADFAVMDTFKLAWRLN
jgi:hypothetical protein